MDLLSHFIHSEVQIGEGKAQEGFPKREQGSAKGTPGSPRDEVWRDKHLPGRGEGEQQTVRGNVFVCGSLGGEKPLRYQRWLEFEFVLGTFTLRV